MNEITLLLSNPSSNLRLLVLKNLLPQKNNDEIRELESIREEDKLVNELAELQNADGSWSMINPLASSNGNKILATSLALTRLGYFGFGRDYKPLKKGIDYLFSIQKKDGSWPFKKDDDASGYAMIPLQTSIPLQGISACGYAEDPRSEKAYEWLLSKKMDDGAWPTGIASSGVYGYVAGYRKIAHSRWGCRSNTTSASICLSRHPVLKKSGEAKRAIDLLLGRDTKDAYRLGYEIARMLGNEPVRGFITFYAGNDLSLMLDLCAKTGISKEDERVAGLIGFIKGLRGKYGLWNYPGNNNLGGWITYDMLRSLSELDKEGGWISGEPVTPFKAYHEKRKRY